MIHWPGTAVGRKIVKGLYKVDIKKRECNGFLFSHLSQFGLFLEEALIPKTFLVCTAILIASRRCHKWYTFHVLYIQHQ